VMVKCTHESRQNFFEKRCKGVSQSKLEKDLNAKKKVILPLILCIMLMGDFVKHFIRTMIFGTVTWYFYIIYSACFKSTLHIN